MRAAAAVGACTEGDAGPTPPSLALFRPRHAPAHRLEGGAFAAWPHVCMHYSQWQT